MACTGHACLQRPQRIHSGWLGVLSTFTSILHAFVHCWQPTHLSFSILIPKNDILLNKEYIAPSGQIHLQKGLYNRMLSPTTVIWMIILGICASPVAVPLAFAAIICLAALLIVVFSLVLSIACVSLACIACSFALFFAKFASPGAAQKLICAGGGFLLLGIGLLLAIATIAFANLCTHGIAAAFKHLFIRKKVS